MSDLKQYKLRVLDTKTPTFCGAKWYNATVFLGSGKTMSCHHNPYHEISDTDVITNYKALHNTSIKKKQRAEMLRGERPKGCEYCWRVEDFSPESISDRVIKTQDFSDEDNNIAFHADPNADFDLQIMELHFDKVCQMACSYCHAGYSTTWAQDIKQNGVYEDVETDTHQHYKYQRKIDQLFKPDQENLYVEAFYKWWDADLHRTLKELRILGGEPLLSPHIWRFIDWYKSKETKCSLEIVTNLGPKVNVDKFLKATEDIGVVVLTSNETVDSHAEYIRDGLDYDLWIQNVEKCLSSNSVREVRILLTVNALSMLKITDLLDQIVIWKQRYGKDRLTFTANILRYPVFQNISVLPKDVRKQLADKLSNWLSNNNIAEVDTVERLISYTELVDYPTTEFIDTQRTRKDFKSFFTQYDKRRGKSFTETFPELADWYGDI